MNTTTYKTLADGNILAHVPFTLVRRGDGLHLMTDEPGANLARNLDMAIVQMLANGLKYRREALSDRFKNRTKMSQHYGFDSSYLTRVIRLGYLSPEIVEMVANGKLVNVTVEQLQKIQTPIWAEQHKELGLEVTE